jgi:hypothetical protein
MESRAPEKPPSKTAKEPSLISTAIDASFQADATVRVALTENLKPLQAESEAIAARLHKAFESFNPSNLSAAERERRHYVAPGADPGDALNDVIMNRVSELQSSDDRRALTLRESAELRSLIKGAREDDDSLRGVVDLDELISFINRKSTVSSLSAESEYTPLTAEIEAEKMLAIAESALESGTGQGTARRKVSALEAREVDRLVKDSVNVQMESVTAPESQLAYGKIPNSADDDNVQRGILQTFELRPGASDVTSYHDFHTLQIAFEHVWSRIFDGQLTSLGRDLYREYVRLKDLTGSTAPDFQVGTLPDLRRLIDEVKKLSQFVDEDIPATLRPAGSEQKNNGLPTPTPEDAARAAGAVATGGASLFIEWAFNELIKAGNQPVRVTWNNFPLKLNEGRGNIIELLPPEQNALSQGTVEIVLETDSNSYKKKIAFQQWDRDTQRPIYSADLQNFGGGHGPIDRVVLNAAQMQYGTLKFISEDEVVNELLLGRYVLGDLTDRLKDRTRVTFRWKGQR